MPSSRLFLAVQEFTSTIVNPYDLADLLQRLTEHAIATTNSDGAGIMLGGRDGLGFAAATPDDVVTIEVLQERIQSGACYEAYATEQLVAVDDLTDTDDWPEYRSRALSLGFHAVLGIPMFASGQTIGVLNIYRRAAGAWREEDIETAQIITAMGAGYVLHANQLRAQHELSEHLQAALESRDLIGQAKGLLMSAHGISAEEAFAMLRSMSQHANVKLRDVAARIIEHEGSLTDL